MTTTKVRLLTPIFFDSSRDGEEAGVVFIAYLSERPFIGCFQNVEP